MNKENKKRLVIIFVLIVLLIFLVGSFYLLITRKPTTNKSISNTEITSTNSPTPTPTEALVSPTITTSPTPSPTATAIPTSAPKTTTAPTTIPTQPVIQSDCASTNKHAFTLNDFVNLVQTASAGDHIQLRASVSGTMKINFPANNSSKAICISYGNGVTSTGLLRFNNPRNVIMQNIKTTWKDGDDAGEHMFRISGGSNWILRNSEVYGAQSYANILVSGGAINWKILKNYIHNVADRVPVNSTVQNHNIYVAEADYGIISGNRITNAPRGRCIKLATASETNPNQPDHNVISYNTFNNCIGPSLVGVSYAASYNSFTKNIFVNAPCILGNNDVTGTGNSLNDNVYWNIANDCLTTHDDPFSINNMKKIDPKLNSSDLPTNSAAAGYGYGAYR